MNSTFDDPFLLSSYTVPTLRRDSIVSAYVSYSEGPKSNGYATVTAQGEGIHVVDVSNFEGLRLSRMHTQVLNR